MNSSGLLFFGVFNVILLILTIGLLVGSFYLTSRRNEVFSRLAASLEMLGFAKRGWNRRDPLLPFEGTRGYYSATIDGRPFEAHFFAEGGRRFKFVPYVEFVLLGYFNTSLFVSTPRWYLPVLRRSMPKKLILPGYEGLEIGTADENSAKVFLSAENTHRIVREMLMANDSALLTIGQHDIHFTVKLRDPRDVQIAELQTWLQLMTQVAAVAAALPPLASEAVYEDYLRAQAATFDLKRTILLVFFILLLMPLIVVGLFLLR